MIHTVKGFGIVNKAKVDAFLELSCLFGDPADVGNLISGLSAFPKSSLNIFRFMVHILLEPMDIMIFIRFLLGLMTILPYICNYKMGFVSNHLKLLVTNGCSNSCDWEAYSDYYLGPLD